MKISGFSLYKIASGIGTNPSKTTSKESTTSFNHPNNTLVCGNQTTVQNVETFVPHRINRIVRRRKNTAKIAA